MKKMIVLMLIVLSFVNGEAQQPFEVIGKQIIHEAFVQPITSPVPIELAPRQPPAIVKETRPRQPAPQTIWIPGYWCWVRENQNFKWICGIWRLAPQGLIWSSGYWMEEEGGWLWVKGAWLPDKNMSQWIYSKTPPPSSKNDNTGNAPGSEYFWNTGYWDYNIETSRFSWLSGSWQKFDSNFILEPANWIWQPEGYLLVPSFWDWSLEARGRAYECKSQKPLQLREIATSLTSHYPNYAATCCHTWHYQPNYWEDCVCIPVWWNWSDWWSMPWDSSWWLWWWYTHDGYPYPPLISIAMIDLLPQPSKKMIEIFNSLFPPVFLQVSNG